jgi:hypothetical protein
MSSHCARTHTPEGMPTGEGPCRREVRVCVRIANVCVCCDGWGGCTRCQCGHSPSRQAAVCVREGWCLMCFFAKPARRGQIQRLLECMSVVTFTVDSDVFAWFARLMGGLGGACPIGRPHVWALLRGGGDCKRLRRLACARLGRRKGVVTKESH